MPCDTTPSNVGLPMFETDWMSHPKFSDFIRNNWNLEGTNTTATLRDLAEALDKW